MLHRSEHKYHIYVRSIQNPHCRRPSSTNMDLRYCALPTSFLYYSVCIVFLRPVVFLSLTAIPGTWYLVCFTAFTGVCVRTLLRKARLDPEYIWCVRLWWWFRGRTLRSRLMSKYLKSGSILVYTYLLLAVLWNNPITDAVCCIS